MHTFVFAFNAMPSCIRLQCNAYSVICIYFKQCWHFWQSKNRCVLTKLLWSRNKIWEGLLIRNSIKYAEDSSTRKIPSEPHHYLPWFGWFFSAVSASSQVGLPSANVMLSFCPREIFSSFVRAPRSLESSLSPRSPSKPLKSVEVVSILVGWGNVLGHDSNPVVHRSPPIRAQPHNI